MGLAWLSRQCEGVRELEAIAPGGVVAWVIGEASDQVSMWPVVVGDGTMGLWVVEFLGQWVRMGRF